MGVPFNLELIDPQLHPKLTAHRVVPIRFARAVDNQSSDDTAPDVDDHGFTIPSAFATVHGAVAGLKGPTFGQQKGPITRIRVMRDRLDNGANLFATIDDASVAEIEFPAAGSALVPTDAPNRPRDCVFLRGLAISIAGVETKLKIHHGSASGPVMAELGVRVYNPLSIDVQAHTVSINGTGPAINQAGITTVFQNIGKIWAQAGITFNLLPTVLPEAVNGFATAGAVTLSNVDDVVNPELQTVLRQNPTALALNAYFIGQYLNPSNVLGIAFSSDDVTPHPPTATFVGAQAGITVADSADLILLAHTAAHEIGHALRLRHYGRSEQPRVRQDIWAHRALMHNFVDLISTGPHNSVDRADVGYGSYANGNISAGELITTKNREPRIPQSNEVDVARNAAIDATFAPVTP
jgi:hypothetical protein